MFLLIRAARLSESSLTHHVGGDGGGGSAALRCRLLRQQFCFRAPHHLSNYYIGNDYLLYIHLIRISIYAIYSTHAVLLSPPYRYLCIICSNSRPPDPNSKLCLYLPALGWFPPRRARWPAAPAAPSTRESPRSTSATPSQWQNSFQAKCVG